MKHLIEIKNICKIFFTESMDTYALKDVSLQIDAGDFVSIEGPSGSGKSTLMNILGLLDNFSSGEYFLLGKDISSFSEKQKAFLRNTHLGFIFQNFNLINHLTVKKNVELPLLYGPKTSKTERHKRVEEVLKSVNLIHRINHTPSQLSGGQQQRVAVARALISNPDIIFADEPTGNLDSSNGNQIMNLLKKLNNEGKTICMVTHDFRYRSYADRKFEIKDGCCFQLN